MTLRRIRRVVFLLLMILAPVLVLLSCGGNESSGGGNSGTTGGNGSNTSRTGTSTAGPRLADVRFWMYQIQNQNESGNIESLAHSRYDLLVVDQTRSIRDEENYDSRADVARLKESSNSRGGRKLVVCYFDVGQAENFRSYWRNGWGIGNPEWIVATDPDGWRGDYPVKYWRQEWKDIVERQLDGIIDDGYDGVYLDWLEVYSFAPVEAAARAEGRDPRAELTAFVKELRDRALAKRPGFIFIAQNASELGSDREYTALFDGCAQEAVWYDGTGDPDANETPGDVPVDSELTQERLDNLRKWRQQGKVVLDVEYASQPDIVATAYKQGSGEGFVTLVTLRLLDSITATPPPGY